VHATALKLINISGIEFDKKLYHFIYPPHFLLAGIKGSSTTKLYSTSRGWHGISNVVSR
jgi:hypothetical protein